MSPVLGNRDVGVGGTACIGAVRGPCEVRPAWTFVSPLCKRKKEGGVYLLERKKEKLRREGLALGKQGKENILLVPAGKEAYKKSLRWRREEERDLSGYERKGGGGGKICSFVGRKK